MIWGRRGRPLSRAFTASEVRATCRDRASRRARTNVLTVTDDMDKCISTRQHDIALNEIIVMPGNLHVRSVDDELIVRLKQRAVRNGRSAEAEHREILREVLGAEPTSSFRALAAELRALTANREHTPSEVPQRDGRLER